MDRCGSTTDIPVGDTDGVRGVVLGLLLVACGSKSSEEGAATKPPAASAGDLELLAGVMQIEEVTESFAAEMLAFSVSLRKGAAGPAIDALFAESLSGGVFPSETTELAPAFGLVHSHGWRLPARDADVSRADFGASLAQFTDHFSVLEDIRFKVATADLRPDGVTLAGELKFWMVGRDDTGRREWVRGRAAYASRREGDRWRVTEFHARKMSSMVAARDLFSEVARPAGVAGDFYRTWLDPSHGLGAAAADVDGDGLVDLFITSQARNFLYLNNGDGSFREASAEAGVAALALGARQSGAQTVMVGPLFLDYDNDGDSDLFITQYRRPQVLFENRLVPDGALKFRDVSKRAGVAVRAFGYSAIAGDVNGDGLPDVYVAAYQVVKSRGRRLLQNLTNATNGTPNLLFLNKGDGRFEESAKAWGVDDSRWSLAAQFVDFDTDGDLDLLVANDYGGGTTLYRNEGGRFKDVGAEVGLFDRGYGMGVSAADYDNDGDLDVHVTNMSSMAGARVLGRLENRAGELPWLPAAWSTAVGNSLYANQNDGTFRKVTSAAGPFPGGWAWGGGFLDIDNDGWEDLHTPNGAFSGKSLEDT